MFSKIMTFFSIFILCFSAVLRTSSTETVSAQELTQNQEQTPAVSVFPDRFDPAEHPDRARLHVTPPDWKTFDGKTQFIALRSFPSSDGKGTDFEATIDRYQNAGLGRILWPHAGTIFFQNLDELAEVVKKRNLFLFDFWGYVPGSGPRESGGWTQFHADPAQFRLLEEHLGEHWLGMDNGEQDGRYIGSYAPRNTPVSPDRFQQYLFFQRHFEQLGDDLGNRLSTLVSLNFGHYFLKEGIYALIGAETAQALPNSQVYYAWIRGAGKQYGVLWFGNASVFNRWGWKSYPQRDSKETGPKKGTSLSLLKRLMYTHILYNSAAVGFENGWFVGDELGPIGKIQQSAAQWLEKNGDPGTMVTSVGILCDFYSGWSFPRHLYTGNSYRVWGNIPYGSGDYLTNDIFGMLYPQYEDSSYFHDERGFLTATPYSDSADALLTDAPSWLLARYPLLAVGGALAPSEELRDKLTLYVQNGGRLLITSENVAAFRDGLCGVRASEDVTSFPAGTSVTFKDGEKTAEEHAFTLRPLTLPENAKFLAVCGNDGACAAAEIPYGRGTVIVLASPFGLASERAVSGTISNKTEESLENPFPLLNHVRKIFAAELNRTVLFDVGTDLGSVVCRKSEKVYTVGVFNNTLEEKPLKITSRIGEIASLRELPTDCSERSTEGFFPEGFENTQPGTDSDTVISGGSVRLFEVTLAEDRTQTLTRVTPPAAPSGRILVLRGETPIQEGIMARPTFFQHYDGVMTDWKYLRTRSVEEIQREAGWLGRQNVKIIVDFSSGINLFPDLRLIKNDPEEYEKSMKTIKETLEKAALLGVKTVILRTHRIPENNYSGEKAAEDEEETLRELCRFAAERGITVALRVARNTPRKLDAALRLLEAVGEANLRLAPTLLTLKQAAENPELLEKVKGKIELTLLAGTLFDENNGCIWSEHAPLSALPPNGLEPLRPFRDFPVVFESAYENSDEEYRDVKMMESF